MDQTQQIVLMAVIAIVGVVATVVYYFARYYFRTHEKDEELAPGATARIEDGAAHPPLKETVARANLESELAKGSEELEAVPLASSADSKSREVATKDLRSALQKTKTNLFGRIKDSFSSKSELSEGDLEELEEILYTSDLGPLTVQRIVESVGESLSGGEKANLEKVRQSIRDEMHSIFTSIDTPMTGDDPLEELISEERPCVWMVVGVNGVGKTTTIGKLANKVAAMGLKVMVIAGDTFRAAASDQLKVWSERAEVEIFSPEGVKDPSAVAFDGCSSALSKKVDVVIVDTAGRLHTQDHLMDELKKMKRVMQKVLPQAPHQTLMVLDSNSGQNALMQARSFNEALEISGVILTKLDGSAKGGVAVGVANEMQIPIRWIGVGESIADLQAFNAKEFVDSII